MKMRMRRLIERLEEAAKGGDVVGKLVMAFSGKEVDGIAWKGGRKNIK